MILNGFSNEQWADSHVQFLVNRVKHEIVTRAGLGFVPFIHAVSFTEQIVAGKIYIVKCHIGDQYLHVKIYESLPQEGRRVQVFGVQKNKSRIDSLEYF
jgi:cystatin-A/B